MLTNKIGKKINCWKNVFGRSQPKLLVLVYHRILPQIKFNPLYTIISLDAFIRQIDILVQRYPVISLNDVIKQRQSGRAKAKTQVVLTFDDGYRDNYEIVFPVLKQKGLPATFCLVTDYIDSGRPLWDWEVITLLTNNKTIKNIAIVDKIIYKKRLESRISFAFRAFKKMKYINPEIRQKVINFLNEQSKNEFMSDFVDNSCMTWEQVVKMSQEGMEIGAHGISHRSLSRIPFMEAADEVRKSKEVIEDKIKKPCIHFAFPFGSKKDYNETLINCVKDAGFQTCLLNVHGYNNITQDSFCFKRIIMKESTDLNYLIG